MCAVSHNNINKRLNNNKYSKAYTLIIYSNYTYAKCNYGGLGVNAYNALHDKASVRQHFTICGDVFFYDFCVSFTNTIHEYEYTYNIYALTCSVCGHT